MKILSEKPLIRAYCCDCMDLMADKPDGFWDLAIVDPEYGSDIKGPCGRFKKYGGLQSVNNRPPGHEYFDSLFKVSTSQIIWGANYFLMPPCQHYIVWDKLHPKGLTFADSEFAWTNFDGVARTFRLRPMKADNYRIHPTQKPVALYLWLLTNYANPGQTILDTHGGSFSSAIACWKMGFDLDICEMDEEYFEAACSRFERETRQGSMFG